MQNLCPALLGPSARVSGHGHSVAQCLHLVCCIAQFGQQPLGVLAQRRRAAAHPPWLARHPRFHVHFTPTSASWLNQVERWFATLTQRCIRRGTHRSTRQLEQTIRQYLDINNAKPKPFIWSKTADDILASIERFCLRTSNSRH